MNFLTASADPADLSKLLIGEVVKELLDEIPESEEEHSDSLETQIDLLDCVGLWNYCQSQIKAGSPS